MAHTNRSFLSALLAAGCSVLALGVSSTAFMGVAQAQSSGERAAVVGGALPGGAIISARSIAVASAQGGAITAGPIADDGSFRLTGMPSGVYRLAVTSTTVAKQTQGATFGEKVNAGLHAAGGALAQGAAMSKHDTAKNAVGNVRGREAASDAPAADPAAASAHTINPVSSMPSRLSMNVTIGRQTQRAVVDETVVQVEVGADGVLAGRVAAP
jgi:hypothetical protein